jgi:rsbT co-antagonist protein RsbR
MRAIFRQLTTIRTTNPTLERRARQVIVLSLGLILFTLIMTPLLLLTPDIPDESVILASFVVTGLSLGAIAAARRAWVGLGACILLAILIVSPLAVIPANRGIAATGMALTLSIVLASLVLRPWQIWLVLVANIVGLVLVVLLLFSGDTSVYVVLGSNSGVLVLLTLFCFVGARITENSFRASKTATTALAEANARLEQRVAERTAEVQVALREVQDRAAAQEQLLAELAEQRAVVSELSVPVLPISATTLVMPLVGTLDSARLADVQERALHAVETQKARYLLLDITGVPVVDTQVAQGLVQVVRATRLLGAQVVLVGVRPEVAQAVVSLGVALEEIITRATLQDGIATVQGWQRQGVHVR